MRTELKLSLVRIPLHRFFSRAVQISPLIWSRPVGHARQSSRNARGGSQLCLDRRHPVKNASVSSLHRVEGSARSGGLSMFWSGAPNGHSFFLS